MSPRDIVSSFAVAEPTLCPTRALLPDTLAHTHVMLLCLCCQEGLSTLFLALSRLHVSSHLHDLSFRTWGWGQYGQLGLGLASPQDLDQPREVGMARATSPTAPTEPGVAPKCVGVVCGHWYTLFLVRDT